MFASLPHLRGALVETFIDGGFATTEESDMSPPCVDTG